MADLLADHNLAKPLVLLMVRRRHDIVSSRDLGLDRVSDGLHLLEASRLGRILLTHNERDFVLLHNAWLRWALAWGVRPQHHGVLVLPQHRQWSPERSAIEIEAVIGRGGRAGPAGITNELWRWRPARGWFPFDAQVNTGRQ